eukprot:scpid107975/ scgid3198/ 
MAKAPWETNWTPDVERFAFIFEHLQTSELAIMTEDIALPTGYALEVGWRGDKTPEIWANLILDTFGESAASFWTADKFTARLVRTHAAPYTYFSCHSMFAQCCMLLSRPVMLTNIKIVTI